jgi:hypothetical protein
MIYYYYNIATDNMTESNIFGPFLIHAFFLFLLDQSPVTVCLADSFFLFF